MAGININKTTGNAKINVEKNDITQEMTEIVANFCNALLVDSDKFEKEAVFNDILRYISTYDRILYAPISNMIYACYDEHEDEEAANLIGTLNHNLLAVVNFSQSEAVDKVIDTARDKTLKDLQDTKKAILKIWDHVNLAQQQYDVLKQSDEEYRKKFNKSISPFKEELTRDMNAQLLTMVGIFTALAFLIFGGISSLDNIFASKELPLLKLMTIGAVWGLCILNLVFVFLFCVGKMTKLNFKSTNNPKATIFQKYPIVWWSNLIIASILVLSGWGHYITGRNIHSWFETLCFNSPVIASLVGTFAILVIIIGLVIILANKTKPVDEEND